jgi:hypothetical protein
MDSREGFVRVQGIVHRSPVECFPANGASVDVGRSLPARARRARVCSRWRDGQGTGRSQFDKVARREDLQSDGDALHPFYTVRTMRAGIAAGGVQDKFALEGLAQRIGLDAAHAAVIGEIDAQ